MSGNDTLQAADFFILRTPALPPAALTDLRSEYEQGSLVASSTLYRLPFVQEAIYLASHNLFQRASADSPTWDKRLELSLARYLFRMATRSTPFGIFAGVSPGKIGTAMNLRVAALDQATRVCRLDQGAIWHLLNQLSGVDSENMPLLREVEVIRNNALWKAPDGWRYAEAHWPGGVLRYRLARLEATDALDFAISRVARPIRFVDLVNQVAEQFETEQEAAESFIAQLVGDQVLLPLPQVLATGEDAVGTLSQSLLKIPAARRIAEPLAGAIGKLKNVGTGSARNIEIYDEVAAILRQTGIDVHESAAIQVDLYRDEVVPEFPRDMIDDLLSQLWSVRALLIGPPRSELADFVAAFTARFGDSTVPLLQALDEDFGIQFTGEPTIEAPLIDGLRTVQKPSVTLGKADCLLLRLAQRSSFDGATEITLKDDDVAQLDGDLLSLPSSFAVVGSFEAVKGKSFGKNDYIFDLTGVFGPSSCNLISRFCCGNAELTQLVKKFLAQSEGSTEETIVAEVAHLPGGRLGNVLLRPVLRSHEIAYMGRSGAPTECQLEPSDLYVSCVNNQIGLFSRRLGKRIVPRITTAHALFSERSLPVYRFLGLLQLQDEFPHRTFWGALNDKLDFFPAVRYRKLRLSPARWLLDSKTTKRISQLNPERDDLLSELKPTPEHRLIRLRQDDNFLELNLDHKLDRATFIEECRRHSSLQLEAVPGSELDLVEDTSGKRFRHEIVLPVVRTTATRVGSGAHSQKLVPLDTANRVPGGDWLYAKIFCGPSVADDFITSVFPDLAAFAENAGARKPFFIRYSELGTHLRFRVQGPPEVVWGPIRTQLENVLRPMLSGGAISRLEYGTYQPELRRYGGEDGLNRCEHVFSLDSKLVSAALTRLLADGEREIARWKFALASMTRLLRLFRFKETDELELLNTTASAYASEYKLERSSRALLNEKYRHNRNFIDDVVATGRHEDEVIEELLLHRDRQASPHVEGLLECAPRHSLPQVAQSLLHMTANRIFPEYARWQEFVIMHFLHKSASSIVGRKKFENGLRSSSLL